MTMNTRQVVAPPLPTPTHGITHPSLKAHPSLELDPAPHPPTQAHLLDLAEQREQHAAEVVGVAVGVPAGWGAGGRERGGGSVSGME